MLQKNGMRIEMKHGRNRLTPEQLVWMTRLTEAGYYCFEARSAAEAIKAKPATRRLVVGHRRAVLQRRACLR